MPEGIERIEAISAEAAAAIEAAPGTAELEELRVRYLGRKAELTAILRGIADLPAAERGAVGVGRQQGAQGAGGADRGARRGARRRRARVPAGRGPGRRDPAGRAGTAGRPRST